MPGDFFFSITKSPPKDMNVEDAVLTKEMKGKWQRDEGTSSNRDKKKET